VTDRERVLAFVARGRARLEAMRLLRAASRGALAGGALGLLAALFARALPPHRALAAAPWVLVTLASLAAAAVARARGRVEVGAAALFFDERLGTQGRLATVATRPAGAFTDRVARELHPLPPPPRLPLPREAALLPAALFLVFAAGLLPRGTRAETSAPAPAPLPGVAAAAETGPAEDVDDLVAAIREGRALSPESAAVLADAVDRLLGNPEERRAALDALAKAAGGDAEGAEKAARLLEARVGGRGAAEATPGAARAGSAEASGWMEATLYAEEQEFLRAYRRAVREGGR
jgi:hypothetical protein